MKYSIAQENAQRPPPPLRGTYTPRAAWSGVRGEGEKGLRSERALLLALAEMYVQIVSKQWGETKVLQAGHAFEQATDWNKRRPRL